MKAIADAQIPEINAILDGGPQTASEDFAYYAQERPSCFFYVGARKEEAPYPHHHPKFDIDEKAMLIAAKSMAAVVFDYLKD